MQGVLGRHEVAQLVKRGSYKPGWLLMGRRCAVTALALGLGLPAAARAAPVASFTYSPEAPLTGEVVTFTSESSGTLTWDLDGEGPPCDDAAGAVAKRSFGVAASYAVWLCVNGSDALAKQTVVVRNRPPLASFTFAPSAPVIDETVTLGSTSVDPDGPIAAQAWDLDGDGVFDDGMGETASLTVAAVGTYAVSLLVTDRDGASSSASMFIPVVKPPPTLLSPSPLVRMTGRFTRRGTRVKTFVVQAPRGASVRVRCRGGRCPYRRRIVKAKAERIRFHSLERRLKPGTTIEVLVTKPDTIGKYIRFRIRKGRQPSRIDRCLLPGVSAPVACPRA